MAAWMKQQQEGNVKLLPGVNAGRRNGERGEHLVGGGQLGPRLVRPAIVVLGLGDLHVLVEAQDLPGLQLCNGGSLTQLQNKEQISCQVKADSAGAVLGGVGGVPHLPGQPPLDLSDLSLSVSLVFG